MKKFLEIIFALVAFFLWFVAGFFSFYTFLCIPFDSLISWLGAFSEDRMFAMFFGIIFSFIFALFVSVISLFVSFGHNDFSFLYRRANRYYFTLLLPLILLLACFGFFRLFTSLESTYLPDMPAGEYMVTEAGVEAVQ